MDASVSRCTQKNARDLLVFDIIIRVRVMVWTAIEYLKRTPAVCVNGNLNSQCDSALSSTSLSSSTNANISIFICEVDTLSL
ncbi:hypothetical protein TNCV_4873901 [Trichonephila clavipes]|nr:hypothetical protein TNCV_4873901 [Trichonephila clavipes]